MASTCTVIKLHVWIYAIKTNKQQKKSKFKNCGKRKINETLEKFCGQHHVHIYHVEEIFKILMNIPLYCIQYSSLTINSVLFFSPIFCYYVAPPALNWSGCASKVCTIKLDWLLFKRQHQLFGCCWKKFFSYLNIHLITKFIIKTCKP